MKDLHGDIAGPPQDLEGPGGIQQTEFVPGGKALHEAGGEEQTIPLPAERLCVDGLAYGLALVVFDQQQDMLFSSHEHPGGWEGRTRFAEPAQGACPLQPNGAISSTPGPSRQAVLGSISTVSVVDEGSAGQPLGLSANS